MPNQKKTAIVESVSASLSRAKAVILLDYRGLTHFQLSQIRKALKTANAELVVIKNTLLKIALGKTGLPELPPESFNGPTGVLLEYEDAISPLKELAKFIKSLSLPTIKIGIVNNQTVSKDNILRLTNLPSREVLYGQLIGGLKSPSFGLANALSGNLKKLVLILKARSRG